MDYVLTIDDNPKNEADQRRTIDFYLNSTFNDTESAFAFTNIESYA